MSIPNAEFTRFLLNRKKGKFNPNRKYIQKAMKEYFARGGRIAKVDVRDTQALVRWHTPLNFH